MRTTIYLLILAAVASASAVHLERRSSGETRAPSSGGYGAPSYGSPSSGGYGAPGYGSPSSGGYGSTPTSTGGQPAGQHYGGQPTGQRPQRRRPMPRPQPYGGNNPVATTTCTDDILPTYVPEETTTCTDDILPTPPPSGTDSGVDNADEVCSTATVTETVQVPVTQVVYETVERPVTVTETVQVTSVQIQPTTVVQPVYQTETVTCTETLPAVYHTVEKTVEHTAYVTATETVYPQPTQAVSDADEQKKPSAYGETAAYGEDVQADYAKKPSAY